MSKKTIGQRHMQHGSTEERALIRAEVFTKVTAFHFECNGLPVHEREYRLMKLVERVARGEEDLEVLKTIVRSGNWLLELRGLMKRTRWLKSLKLDPEIFGGRT